LNLDGFTTNGDGYFYAWYAADPQVSDLVFAGNLLQNGQDAVALYALMPQIFPNNTPVTTTTCAIPCI
jgi:hypothetical protein